MPHSYAVSLLGERLPFFPSRTDNPNIPNEKRTANTPSMSTGKYSLNCASSMSRNLRAKDALASELVIRVSTLLLRPAGEIVLFNGTFRTCMRPAHLFLLLLMNLGWASVYSAYKIIALPAGGIVTLRFGFAAVALLLIWPWLPGMTPHGRDLVKSCLMGLLLYVVGQRLQV